ncbi:type II secretion system protein GspG [Luteolibacter flavescens]|uniref:Type II secretion system protein GspG n=1 Tax=Luteolibacter flavescens TaxID=1859460 RepID=A0ABT3FU29_9BACT|nr:type II secretion system protein GspG [Luteolibacter flavescens]MCW1886799.1 type II secretion system protein GspG [Luteolibacter flavescens]
MKIQGIRRRHAGFSLMELVVVVAIILALAGLTLGAFGFVNQKNARTKAKLQVDLLSGALQKYHSENKSYPDSPDANGDRGDEVLYKALYWDAVEADKSSEIYLDSLDPQNNTKGGQAWIQGTNGQARIVDPWGNFYRYRTGSQARNPDFDLWSAGPDGKTNTDPKHKDSLDDIRNF